MANKPPSAEFPTQHFASASDFEKFLEREHATAPGVYVKMAKKASGIASISGAEAVEVALCFGWIDGRANNIDEKWWTVRYTPRRAKSVWSKKNVDTVSRLLADNRMRPAGIAAVEAAKSDGRWERAYAGPATIVVPEDLASALAGNPAAAQTFETMDKVNRYAILWRIETATPSNRANRIQSLVQMIAEGKLFHEPTAKPIAKRKVKSEPVKASDTNTKPKLSSKRRQVSQSTHTTQTKRVGLRPR